jgi:DNA-binding response OmpR family regulator
MKALLVDADQAMAELLKMYMANEGWDSLIVNDGLTALDVLRKDSDIGLIVLDIMLPNISGLTVLKRIRREISLPIIIVSAKTNDEYKIECLLSGADDYVIKPFNPLEVVARIHSILRRYSNRLTTYNEEDELHVGTLSINYAKHTVTTDEGERIALTSLEFGILYLLASHPGKVYLSKEIFEQVWHQDSIVSVKTVMVHVSHLREKLMTATHGNKVIETVWGVGYKINGNEQFIKKI